MQNTTPTFGQYLRAARLGFRWSADHRCMIRMADGPDDGATVTLSAPDALPTTPSKTPHRCWWDDPGILRMSSALETLRESGITPTGIETWVLDADGCRLS